MLIREYLSHSHAYYHTEVSLRNSHLPLLSLCVCVCMCVCRHCLYLHLSISVNISVNISFYTPMFCLFFSSSGLFTLFLLAQHFSQHYLKMIHLHTPNKTHGMNSCVQRERRRDQHVCVCVCVLVSISIYMAVITSTLALL